MNPIENTDKQQISPVSENTMSNISTTNYRDVNHVEQNYNHAVYFGETLFNYENNIATDCISQTNNNMYQQITYGDGIPLSEASLSSSMDIRTANMHPVYNGNSIPSEIVREIAVTHTLFGDHPTSPTATVPTQHWNQYQEPSMIWTSSIDTTNDSIVTPSVELSYSPSSNSEENDEPCSNPCLSETEEEMMAYSNSPHPEVEEVRMMANYNNNDQQKGLPPRADAQCDPTAIELIQSRLKKEGQPEESQTSFRHLSREELIQRVVELEREKQLNSQLLGAAAVSSDQAATTTAQAAEGSDEDELHPCRWTGCDILETSLEQLIVHIKEAHIGSGKAAYICEWVSCPREYKPFLKRHKMQNHVRTHTGERPFECHVEGCDKRFSRPDSLNTHIKTHSSIRPYTCEFENCSKTYFHSRSLRKHTKSHESAAVVAAAVKSADSTGTSVTPTTAAIAHTKEEDGTTQRQQPYDSYLKPRNYYHLQVSCVSEVRQHSPLSFTPMMINNAVSQKQTQQQFARSSNFFNNANIFEAGSAYNTEVNAFDPEAVEQQLLQHHQRLEERERQLFNCQRHHHQQQQHIPYQQHHLQQASISYNNQSLSAQLNVPQQRQQQELYHDYSYYL